jgi:hypothetical protein
VKNPSMPGLTLKPTHNAASVCRGSLNPNISIEAVGYMRHTLTESLFRKVIDVAHFIQRNITATEIGPAGSCRVCNLWRLIL